MDSDRKKNIKALQASDGTFELVVDDLGFEEISEEEISVVEEESLVNETLESSSSKLLPILLVFTLAAVSIGVLFVFVQSKRREDLVRKPLPIVQGFKPYSGNALNGKKTKRKSVPLAKSAIKKAESNEDTRDSERREEENVVWDSKNTLTESPDDRIEANRNPSPEEWQPSPEAQRAKEEAEDGADEMEDTRPNEKATAPTLEAMGRLKIDDKTLETLKNLPELKNPVELEINNIPLNLPNPPIQLIETEEAIGD